jgi:4'-phosphopantetheinyl transferase
MKEAYTKALGLGMGFEFSRIEYDLSTDRLMVDGEIPNGWQLIKFEVAHDKDIYQGVAARFVGGDGTVILPRSSQGVDWLIIYDAASFVSRAIEELK